MLIQLNLVPDKSLLAIVAIFLVTYFVVRNFFLRPINAILVERETDIRTAEQLHEQSLARFNEATAQMESQLHVAKKEAAAVRDKFRAEAAEHRQGVIDRTSGEAKQIVSEADAKLAADVKVARDRIVTEAESLAHTAAERILGRAV